MGTSAVLPCNATRAAADKPTDRTTPVTRLVMEEMAGNGNL